MPTRTPPRPADRREGVFRALADSTRREVVERLGRGPASVSDLAGGFDMALPSFVEHLRVLEASGLVRSEKHGRVRTYALAPEGLRPLEDWLSAQRRLWERRLDQFDEYVRQLHVAEQEATTPRQLPEGQTGDSR
ncbi:MAG: metalloregulator ArsR/SmtB family transcription factor [Dehalococcoidia bacterium]